MISNDISLAAWRRVAQALPVDLQGYAREWAQAVEACETSRADHAAHIEWELWRSLCNALKEAGAVTDKDLKSRTFDRSTPGCRLLGALRAWGDTRAAIARSGGK